MSIATVSSYRKGYIFSQVRNFVTKIKTTRRGGQEPTGGPPRLHGSTRRSGVVQGRLRLSSRAGSHDREFDNVFLVRRHCEPRQTGCCAPAPSTFDKGMIAQREIGQVTRRPSTTGCPPDGSSTHPVTTVRSPRLSSSRRATVARSSGEHGQQRRSWVVHSPH